MANSKQGSSPQGTHGAEMQTLLEAMSATLLEDGMQGQAGGAQGGNSGAMAQGGQKAHCYELTIPPGMTLNEAQQAIFEEQARELGLSNVSAQKLLEISYRNAQAHRKAHQQQVELWGEEVRQDRELGGPAMEATLAYAKAGLARFDPERQVFGILQETGYANHPQVIRFLAAIGKAHAEDGVFLGAAAPAQTPRHERLYGKYNK